MGANLRALSPRRTLCTVAIAVGVVFALPVAPSVASGPLTGSVTMVSEAGDYIGRGTDQLLEKSVSLRGSLEDVQVSASDEAGSASLEFEPPSGKSLEVGEYVGARRAGFQPAGLPGVSVSDQSSGCNQDYGRFIVKDIHATAGKIDRFWALYEQHCESPHAAALFGEVRIGEPPTSSPEQPVPSAVEWPETWVGSKSLAVPVTVIAGESGAHVTSVELGGADPSDFSLLSNGCEVALGAGARCVVSVAATPTAPGLRTAELVFTDSTGAKTEVPLGVEAEPSLQLGFATMVSEPGDWVGEGADLLFDSPGKVFVTGGLGGVQVSTGWLEGFSFEFAPPKGQQLEVGEYRAAERNPFQAEGHPGLSVSGDGRGCNTDYGRFIVKDIHVNGAGEAERFWALYEQHCERRNSPALFGEVRVGEPVESAPEAVQPDAIEWPPTPVGLPGAKVPVTIIAGEAGASIGSIAIQGPDAADFSVTARACDTLAPGGRCEVDVGVEPATTGALSAQLVINDSLGAQTVVPLGVLGEPPIAPQPAVVTGGASALTGATATLNGTVNPNGYGLTACRFEYGPSNSYGHSVACTTLPGAGSNPVAVSASIAGLSAGATYHFRLVATNVGATGSGEDVSFESTPSSLTAAGAPHLRAASATPNTGSFQLEWPASSDPADPTGITYQLQHENAAGSWEIAAAGIKASEYTFSTGAPEAQGSWIYRVLASDDGTETNPSPASSAVVVDRTGPYAPRASASRAPDYVGPGGEDWFKGNVEVLFAQNGDQPLPDGSPGAGVDPGTLSQPAELTSTGKHEACGTVADVLGNVSAPGCADVFVDASAPMLSVACPTTTLVDSVAVYATVTASDEGSGLVSDPSGLVPLYTDVPGEQTVSRTVSDHVGNETTASCTTSVVYEFAKLKPAPRKIYKRGRSVPVSFRLRDALGAVADGSATIEIAPEAGPEAGVYRPASSIVELGDEFAYKGHGVYHYSLATAGLAIGSWSVRVKVGDGSTHSTSIIVK